MGYSATERKGLKKALLQALFESLGVPTPACKAVGIDPSTFYRWLKADRKFAKDVAALGNVALDFVESKLFKRIQDGDTTSIIFYLKTKGRDRGYIEKRDVTIERKEEKSIEEIMADIEAILEKGEHRKANDEKPPEEKHEP
jgi:hypothetical protein